MSVVCTELYTSLGSVNRNRHRALLSAVRHEFCTDGVRNEDCSQKDLKG